MNHQGLLRNVHCVATVVLRKQSKFESTVIRSNRSSCFTLSSHLINLHLGVLCLYCTLKKFIEMYYVFSCQSAEKQVKDTKKLIKLLESENTHLKLELESR